MITNILEQLVRDEGIRLTPYWDTRGFTTVGVGHNLDTNPLPDLAFPITEAQATQILGKDVERISTYLQHQLPWIVSLDDARHGVLQNMAFNLGGNGLLGFSHMLSYVQAGEYDNAADAMIQSKWYIEVGDRAKRLVQQMRSGEWV